MNFARTIATLLVPFLVTACSTTTMVESTIDGKTGRTETRTYSKFYNAATWVEESKLGLEVWVDHEKGVIPILHSIQQATGTLGSSDLRATGLITIYFVNLDQVPKVVRISAVTTSSKERASPLPPEITVQPRSRAKLEAGRVPIFNYATYVDLNIDYTVDGINHSQLLKLSRLTDTQMENYSGPSGKNPPYPWFKAPYFPFVPPLSRQE